MPFGFDSNRNGWWAEGKKNQRLGENTTLRKSPVALTAGYLLHPVGISAGLGEEHGRRVTAKHCLRERVHLSGGYGIGNTKRKAAASARKANLKAVENRSSLVDP